MYLLMHKYTHLYIGGIDMCVIRKFHTLWQVFLALCFLFAYTDAADGCWSKNDCIIRATLHEDGAEGSGYPIEINCLPGGVNGEQRTIIKDSHVLELDGFECYTKQESYGFEFIPNCNEVVKVSVRRFLNDVLQHFQCPTAFSGGGGGDLSLEVVEFKNNDISTISEESLRSNFRSLRELHFHSNNLRHIYQHAFDSLHSIEVITFENEPQLIIKDARIFEQNDVVTVKFDNLKLITAQLFQHLPSTLKHLTIKDTEIAGHTVEFINAYDQQHIMDSVTLVNCELEAFTLVNEHWVIRSINLSGNAIVHMQLGNASDVETLDLSRNALTQLPNEWLQSLNQLRHLYLRGNQLNTISIRLLIVTAPSLLAIDLRDNQLTALSDESVDFEFEQMPRVRIDRNPWNCIALQNFALTHPEKFRFFQYDKFISQINVNGLACNPVEIVATAERVKDAAATATTQSPTATTTVNIHSNVPLHKGVIYNELDHRSQRTEALIIVFMLPVGIAILFVILYMWIYCEKLFHLSYYRCSFPTFKRRTPNVKGTERRADIVRHIPPGTVGVNDGYELPLNGLTNCNCNNAHKCQKRHHLTYVTLPAERPYLIYEEIIDDVNDMPPSGVPHEPGYDHLTFVGPIDTNANTL